MMAYNSPSKKFAYQKRKSDFLGMNPGVATRRLRKLVLFNLLKRLGENICFRCARIIENPDDLTMDHKNPWLWVDSQLFWDLENVAFAHADCNTAAGRRNITIGD
jgi:5-methylcytosine-specific restriction endonuclease McrA